MTFSQTINEMLNKGEIGTALLVIAFVLTFYVFNKLDKQSSRRHQ